MRSFLSARRFQSNHQPILVYINAGHVLRNHAAIVRMCNAGTSLIMLGDKMLAIANSSFGGMGWDHAVAGIVEQESRQEMVGFRWDH